MDLQEGDVVWWNTPENLLEWGTPGVYRIAGTPWNNWGCVVIENKNHEFLVANLTELEKLNLPWN